MRYFENKSNHEDKEIGNQFDFLRWLLVSIVVCPLRLLMEISYKVLLLGEEIKDYLKMCIILNVTFLVFCLMTSLLISKRIYFANTFIPIPSLIVSLLLLVSIYFGVNYFNFFVSFNEVPTEDDVTFNPNGLKSESEDVELNMDDDLGDESIKDSIDDFIDTLVPNGFSKEKVDDLKEETFDKLSKSLNNFPSEIQVDELYISEKEKENEVTDGVLNSLTDDEILEQICKNLPNEKSLDFGINLKAKTLGTSDLDSVLANNGYGNAHSSILKDKEVLNVMEDNSSLDNALANMDEIVDLLDFNVEDSSSSKPIDSTDVSKPNVDLKSLEDDGFDDEDLDGLDTFY